MPNALKLFILIPICLIMALPWAASGAPNEALSGRDVYGVVLSLKGIRQYADFSGLKVFLQNHPHLVKSFYPCRLEWRQAHFDLMMSGSIQNLITELENSGKYFVETKYQNSKRTEIYLQVKEEAP